jgi:AraC-like DNA-binding protein
MQVLGGGEMLRPVVHFPRHAHPHHWEMLLFVEGAGYVDFPAQRLEFQPLTLLAIPPGVAHEEHADLGYRTQFLQVVAPPWPADEPRVGLDDTAQSCLRTGRLLVAEMREHGAASAAAQPLAAALGVFWERALGDLRYSRWVDALKRALDARAFDPGFSCDEVCAGIPVSADHLRRQFRRETGLSPVRYVQEKRIAEAKRLLGVAGFSVKEASYQTGFQDPYYFSRLFKKIVGKPPSAFCQ